MKSKVFDALLLIEIKIMITKLSEENYGLVRRIIENADELDRYKNGRKRPAAG